MYAIRSYYDFGGSCACTPDGAVVEALDDTAWATLSMQVDTARIAAAREALPFLTLRREALYGTQVPAVGLVRQTPVDPMTAPSFYPAREYRPLETPHA